MDNTERQAIEAEPCPFCEGTAITIPATRMMRGNRYYGYCNDCSATGPQCDTRLGAQMAWNQRGDHNKEQA
jgi:hypothetical protein